MSNKKDAEELDILRKEYDLGGARSAETHYYLVQTEVLIRKPNGKRKSIDTFSLHLIVEPGNQSSGEADKFTCTRFTVQSEDGPEVTIPSLAGWSYEVNKQLLDDRALDNHGQLYAIPEEKFKVLIDSTGKKLSFDAAYQVYSAFVYYHSFVAYAEPIEGKGIQDLKKIGDKIVLEHSFSEDPIPGELAAKGSVYKTGEETMEFKGLSVVDDVPCAMLGFDWGRVLFDHVHKAHAAYESEDCWWFTLSRRHLPGSEILLGEAAHNDFIGNDTGEYVRPAD